MRLSRSTAVRILGGAAALLTLALVPFAVSGGDSSGPAAGAAPGPRYAPGPEEADSLASLERYWSARLTYPTGRFDHRWVLEARKQDALVRTGVPAGRKTYRPAPGSPLVLSATGFTSLGPAPEDISGYGLVSGRVNAIAIDPVQPNVAYFGSVGGGVWKTTNCCTAGTTWAVVTDQPQIDSSSIDDLHIDPSDHNTVYAGTGDLNFGSFAMGTVGVLRSRDQGTTWEVLGASVFTPVYPPSLTPTFPQYQAIGKVRVDPNAPGTIIAGTKTGLYFSYDSGSSWSGPCLTNAFSTQRQDTTGLIARDDGATTTLYAAVGTRGYATTVQPNLGSNGANGIYSISLPAPTGPDGCPAPAGWSLLTTGANGWPAGTGGGIGCNPTGSAACTAGANTLGRIDLAISPSAPNTIYAEVQAVNTQSTCGNARGCFLGLWRTTDGGATWEKRADAADMTGPSGCGSARLDTAQNWYNQGLAVSPTDPDVLFMDAIDIWKSTNGGTSITDVTCGYGSGTTHVDQHALTFVPGSATTMLAGNDGGIYLTLNADAATPAFAQLNSSVNTIELYSGDISANFATSASPFAVGGAQDNGSSSYEWTTGNPGPATWVERSGGDGMFARIEPQQGQRVYMESQWGNLVKSEVGHEGPYAGASGAWGPGNAASVDRESFVTPYEIDKHVCTNFAGVPEPTCGHMILGTYRVWETITGAFPSGQAWYVNSLDLTKCNASPCTTGLADRAIINQLAYAFTDNKVAIVGTNDGNVQYGFGLGQGPGVPLNTPTANWVNVTGGNAVLPNRPILDVVTGTDPLTGYAAAGGFDQNTPATPGHVFQVACTAGCAGFTWTDKTGNLPNIPVDSIMVNPKWGNGKQVFAGTDWGLYYTDDVTVASPTWYRFEAGLPHTMIWDMVIDRGQTTLALFTRSRGAYAWPLPSGPIGTPTAVAIGSFQVKRAGRNVSVGWRTASETDALGFNVWRYGPGATAVRVNRALVAAKAAGRASGASYRLADRLTRPGAYTYRLQSVARTGKRTWQTSTTLHVRR